MRLDDCWWLLSEPFLELVNDGMAVKSRSGMKANTESWERGTEEDFKALVSEYRRIKPRPDEVRRLWSELILVWSIGNGKE